MTSTLVKYITTELLLPSESEHLETNADLWATGLLTSLQFMRLVSFIEAEWGISIPSEDMVLENFQSIDAIGKYIELRTSN